MTHLQILRPNVSHVWNVFEAHNARVFRSEYGMTLDQLAPKTVNPVLCSVNGEFFKHEDWQYIEIVPHIDVVIFHVLPLGNGGAGQSIMAIVGIALIAYGAFSGNPALIAYGAGFLIGGLVPLPSTGPIANITPQTDSPSPTYNIQLSGNTARLGQALPVLYGRHIITPDFAGQPYQSFGEADTQFYYALLSFGMMTHFRVEVVLIGNTPVTQFEDIQLQYIGAGVTGSVPGVGAINTLSLVHAAVATAPEIANQELSHTEYVGPFAVCGQSVQVSKIGIDVICPNGLYYGADDGTLTPKSFTILIEYRRIHPTTGAPAGSWSILGLETVTRTQNSPVRVSFEYTVTPDRYQVRASRQDEKDSNARAGHTVQWAGLRGFLTTPTPLDTAGNYLAVRAKATNQLSGLSQRKIALIIQRWLPSWSPSGGGTWLDPEYTRAIAWTVADIAKNPEYGMQLTDSQIDLATLYDLHLLWTSRGDTFNGIFDTRLTAWEALTTVLRCGRARPIMRGSVLTFVRDQIQELPTAIFTQHVNIQRDSFKAKYTLVTSDEVDGVEVAFFNEKTWETDYFRLPAPGGPEESLAPVQVQLQGITNLKQAQRECAFHAACLAYRRSEVSFTTEMDGYMPPYGDVIGVVHDVMSAGHSGVVESWDGITAIGSEEISWTVGDNYCVLRSDEGDVMGPFRVTAGSLPRSFTFIDYPSIQPYTGTEQERTVYAIGPGSAWAKEIKLTNVLPSSNDTVNLSGFIDDRRVYTADTPYLGIDSDSGGDGGSGGGGGGGPGSRLAVYVPDDHPTYTAASDAQRSPAGFYCDDDLLVEGDAPYTYV